MKDEYIRRQDAVDACGKEYQPNTDFERGMVCQMIGDKVRIERLQPADVAPVVHGRWIDADFCGQYECSECGNNAVDLYDYCPFCGAKMDGEE